MIKLNYPYRCRHCGKTYAVLKGRYTWSFLPVEIIRGDEMNDPEYDKEKHTSHLLNCPQLQVQWKEIKKVLNNQFNKAAKIL